MDSEARARNDHHEALRLWLRLLTCTQLIEKRLRANLRDQFDTTLPRFDLMSQLERAPDGLKMSELSRRMMVTGGNVTAITDQLVKEGLVERVTVVGDRRAFHVRMTGAGRAQFRELAQAHEQWVIASFASLDSAKIQELHRMLGEVKQAISA
jgi:DNA-binding MarR family transcriptional regulator